MGKTTITKEEYKKLNTKKVPSRMEPKKDASVNTEIKMLKNEVAALWKAHTELLVLYNKLEQEEPQNHA